MTDSDRSEAVQTRLAALIAKWQQKADDRKARCREANHNGNIELDAYHDGHVMAYGDCINDVKLLLQADAGIRPAPLELVRQRACDFGEGYHVGYDDGLNGNASDVDTAWCRSNASAELAALPAPAPRGPQEPA